MQIGLCKEFARWVADCSVNSQVVPLHNKIDSPRPDAIIHSITPKKVFTIELTYEINPVLEIMQADRQNDGFLNAIYAAE